MQRLSLFTRLRLDGLGIGLSGLCALHCIASIFIVGALGLGGQALLSPDIHKYGLALAVALGALTIGLGALRHGRVAPLALGSGGIVLMAAAIVGPHGAAEAALTITGVAAVAAAHIANLRVHYA